MSNGSFIEVACSQLSEKGQSVSGDVYLKGRYNGHTVLVLSDGAGSGIKANVVASVIASMALNYTKDQRPMLQTARALIDTFARGKRKEDVNQATFTIVDIADSGDVRMLEFANPKPIVFRGSKTVDIVRQKEEITVGDGQHLNIYISEFTITEGDRIVLFTDGVPLSGYATRRMPFGWSDEGVKNRLVAMIENDNEVSAAQMCRNIILDSEANDLFSVKNDITCAGVYFRRPRRVLVCSGPPYDESNDKHLSDMVLSYKGSKIICGGTTAQIISRESGREISVIMKRDRSGLPPESAMDGVGMVTEGVLTLSKVKLILDALKSDDVSGNGIDSRFVRMLLSHDIVEFIVGTKINAVHHDPTLPMELELRRTIIKDIAKLLEQKFMKRVYVKYI